MGGNALGVIERKDYLNQEDFRKLERKTKERSSQGSCEVVRIVVGKSRYKLSVSKAGRVVVKQKPEVEHKNFF